jgi:hypothetical protein
MLSVMMFSGRAACACVSLASCPLIPFKLLARFYRRMYWF